MTPITRAQLAEGVAATAEITRGKAVIVVDTVFETIKEALKSGEEVEIRGFGSFRLRSRKERLTRNPRTGSPVLVPPKRVPFFRPGKAMREQVNAADRGAPGSSPAIPEES